MTAFEYASGLISIVIGLAAARVLGGIGTFIVGRDRSFSDWMVAAWCVALVFVLVGWWMVGWVVLRGRSEIAFTTLFLWIVASALLYLGAFVLLLRLEFSERLEERLPGLSAEACQHPFRSLGQAPRRSCREVPRPKPRRECRRGA